MCLSISAYCGRCKERSDVAIPKIEGDCHTTAPAGAFRSATARRAALSAEMCAHWFAMTCATLTKNAPTD